MAFQNFSQDPIKVSVVSILVAFIIAFVFLYAVKPKFVMKVDTSSQTLVLSYPLLFIYSGLFAILIGIIALLWRSAMKNGGVSSYQGGSFKQPFGVSPSQGSQMFSFGKKCGYSFGKPQQYGCGCG